MPKHGYSYRLVWRYKRLDGKSEIADDTTVWDLATCLTCDTWPQEEGERERLAAPPSWGRALDAAVSALFSLSGSDVVLSDETACVLACEVLADDEVAATIEPTRLTIRRGKGRRHASLTHELAYADAHIERG